MTDTEYLYTYFVEEYGDQRNDLDEIIPVDVDELNKCILIRRGIISDYENKKEDK